MNTSLFVVTKFFIWNFLEVLNSKPTQKVLRRLAKQISYRWEELGVKLDVDHSTIQSILVNNIEFPTPNQKGREMLVKWSQMTVTPTYGKLEEALRAS